MAQLVEPELCQRFHHHLGGVLLACLATGLPTGRQPGLHDQAHRQPGDHLHLHRRVRGGAHGLPSEVAGAPTGADIWS